MAARRPPRDAEPAKAVQRFLQDNPKIAEAMQTIGLSADAYYRALTAAGRQRVITTSSTVGGPDDGGNLD